MKHKIIAICQDKRGKIISMGMNSYKKTHPLQAHFASLVGMPKRIYLHAEIQAIVNARNKKIHKISVFRYNKRGELLPSKPCPICTRAILDNKIPSIEFLYKGVIQNVSWNTYL